MFTKIDALIWSDFKYKTLSDDSKFLFIYILTCPHRNILGFYFLPAPYGAFDLGWAEERFIKGLKELLEKGFINYDFNTNIVFIKNFLKYNPLENPNQVKGAIKALETLPAHGISIEFVECLKTIDKPFIKPLIERLYELLGKQEEVKVKEEVDVEVKEEVEKEKSSGNSYPQKFENKSKDENLSKIAIAFEQSGFGTINFTVKELLIELLEQYPFEWIEPAMKKAVEANKRSIGYVRGILKNWNANGGMKLETDKSSPPVKKFDRRTKFHPEQSRTEKYTADEINKKVEVIAERKRQEARERMKNQGGKDNE